MSKRYCKADGCACKVPQKPPMCAQHWHMLTPSLRQAILRAYRPDKESEVYVSAVNAAIEYIRQREGR